ncbi:FHA domain-containing protein [archaeon]|mgnify:CR=1 FL=1|jgi:hypothetical protein|nr:FHA domain-containing protein [archaeon]
MALFSERELFIITIFLVSKRKRSVHQVLKVRLHKGEVRQIHIGRHGRWTRRGMIKNELKEGSAISTPAQRSVLNFVPDISVPRDYLVSEDHALIEISPKEIWFQDKGSKNGSRYLEGMEIDPSNQEIAKPGNKYRLVAPCTFFCGSSNNFAEIQIRKSWSIF